MNLGSMQLHCTAAVLDIGSAGVCMLYVFIEIDKALMNINIGIFLLSAEHEAETCGSPPKIGRRRQPGLSALSIWPGLTWKGD